MGAESKFNVDIAPAEFLSCPTFGRFSTLVTSEFEGEESRPGLEDNLPAPSVASQHQALSKQWSYHSVSVGNLVFALNTEGKNRPIFWFFQSESEFISLGKALGPNQPLYGMRSLVGIVPMESYEDNYRQIGELVYREIQNLLGQGPYLLGGNCQAAVLALDVARRTTEDKIPPHTLILMEWAFSYGRYDDRTLLLYGKESSTAEWYTGDIQKQFWRDDFPESNVGVIAGTHGEFFMPKNIGALAGYLLDLSASL